MAKFTSFTVAMAIACFGAAAARANNQINVPAGFSVPAISSTGASFTYTGTAVPGDTVSITVTGPVTLESGGAYGTNAAGVVVIAGHDGNQPVGSALACATIDSIEFDCGSLIVSIQSGGHTYYGRLFPASRKNGLGRHKPPEALTYKASLKTLFGKDSGYQKFKWVNPVFTLLVSDSLYSDNTGSFTIVNN